MPQWTEQQFRLFLSHLSDDKRIAGELQSALLRWNINTFVAHNDIQPTAHWLQEIEEALDSMDALAALLTPNFRNSAWTDHEVGWALGRKLLILPLRLGLDPYGLFGKYQAYTIKKKDFETIASDIASLLIRHQLSSSRMAAIIVSVFENSGSYMNAMANMKKIEEIPHLSITSILVSRIKKAVSSNSQVRDAFGVPERVEAFAAQVQETWQNNIS